MEEKLILAENHLENKNYKDAEEIFTEIAQANSEDFRGYWGLVKALTENFTKYNLNSTQLATIKDYAKTALALASDQDKEMIKSAWNKYKEDFKNNSNTDKNNNNKKSAPKNLQQKSAGIEKQLTELNATYETLNKSLANAEKFTKYADLENCVPLFVLMGIGVLPMILDLFLNICPGWGKAIYIVLLALIFVPLIIMITARMTSEKTNNTIADLKVAVNDIKEQLDIKTQESEDIKDTLGEISPKTQVERPRSKQTEYQLKILQQLYNNKKITYAEYKRKKKELLKNS